MTATTCRRCEGRGFVDYTRDVLGPDGSVVGIESGRNQCRCRIEADPIEGDARTWATEQVHHKVLVTKVFQETLELSVTAEVPFDTEYRRVVRRGNRWYPTFVELAVSTNELGWLFPDEVRTIAAALVEAADKADAIDKPDTDPCGHWHPCDCGRAG